MSHHLDSPEARADVRLDITDYYVFRGRTGTVFLVNLSPSIAGPDAPHGFHPEARYEFRIDCDGDQSPELAYRFAFGAASGDRQSLTLTRLDGPSAGDDRAEGAVLATGFTGEEILGEGGVRLWAGPAHDPFFLDATVLHAVGDAFAAGTQADLSQWSPATAQNVPFGANNVYAIVLEVPDEELLASAPDGRIDSWALTVLATDAGGWRTINRAGLPMIHPLFAQHDDHLADHLNTATPAEDRKQFGEHFAAAIAKVVAAYGTAVDPDTYGRAVADKLLPNVLPYTVGTEAVFGYGVWNGRSLIDSAPDVMFSLATNTAFTTAVTKESVPFKPTDTFPYAPVIV
ncbi:hypothetical protein GCM10009839_22110 [Catenulispora yoronensis]|uniref:DUF4331 domain-containing protein n=1 Tax=Catenulispora yoronensis TaxID=450799 RepID=A0ABP5FGB8_9ACTN